MGLFLLTIHTDGDWMVLFLFYPDLPGCQEENHPYTLHMEGIRMVFLRAARVYTRTPTKGLSEATLPVTGDWRPWTGERRRQLH